MIYEDKKLRTILEEYGRKNAKRAWHIQSKLNCHRFENQLRLCAKLIAKNGKVLDLGCGVGHTTAVLKILRPDLKIIGIDIEKRSSWDKLKKFGINYLIGDVTNLKIKDKSIDAITSFGLMEHVNGDKKLLEEMYRVLKPNGLNLMFSLPNQYSLNEFLAKLFGLKCHDKRYAKAEIKRKFKKAGFRDVKLKRRFLIPSQIGKVSKLIDIYFNKYYKLIYDLDEILTKTPLNIFSQTYVIKCKK